MDEHPRLPYQPHESFDALIGSAPEAKQHPRARRTLWILAIVAGLFVATLLVITVLYMLQNLSITTFWTTD